MLSFEPRLVSGGGGVTAALLAEWWPEARRRVVAALRAAGIDRDVAEDAIAEAAARALARGLIVQDAEEFCRWAFVVARNEVWDGTRKNSRVVPLDFVPEQLDHYDLADHVETRHRLQEAVRVIGAMSSVDRGALLDAVKGSVAPDDRKAAVKLAVRRHRARSRLQMALGAPAGWVGAPALSRWAGPFSRLSPELVAMAIAVPLFAAGAFFHAPAGAADAGTVAAVASPTSQASGPRVVAPRRVPASHAAPLRAVEARGGVPAQAGRSEKPPTSRGRPPLASLPTATKSATSLEVDTPHAGSVRAEVDLTPGGAAERAQAALGDVIAPVSL